jgi:tetratricopeptide (TPR) repeat protein
MFGKVYGETGVAIANRETKTSEEYIASLNEQVFYFLRSQKFEPENGRLLSNMGTAFEQLGKMKRDKHLLERSVELYEQASKKEGVPDMSYNIASTYKDFAVSAPLDAGYYEKADAYFEKALSSDFAPPLTRLYWANSIVAHARRVNFDNNSMNQAFEQFEKCHDEYPEEGVVLHDWGLAWLEAGSHNYDAKALETAITFFERAERMNYRPVTLYTLWGDTLVLLARLEGFNELLIEQALQQYEHAKAVDNSYVFSFFSSGKLLVEVGLLSGNLDNVQAGIASLKQAADLDPSNVDIFNYLGNALLGLAQRNANNTDMLKEAVTVFEQAVSINPKHFAGFANLGSLYFLLGKLNADHPEYYAKSEGAFLDAVQLNRTDAQLTGQILNSLPQFENHHLTYTVAVAKWAIKSFDELAPDNPILEMMYKEQVEQLRNKYPY